MVLPQGNKVSDELSQLTEIKRVSQTLTKKTAAATLYFSPTNFNPWPSQ